jgi:hypothetical protein
MARRGLISRIQGCAIRSRHETSPFRVCPLPSCHGSLFLAFRAAPSGNGTRRRGRIHRIFRAIPDPAMARRGLISRVQGWAGPDLGAADCHVFKMPPGTGAGTAASRVPQPSRLSARSTPLASKARTCLRQGAVPDTGRSSIAAVSSGPAQPVRQSPRDGPSGDNRPAKRAARATIAARASSYHRGLLSWAGRPAATPGPTRPSRRAAPASRRGRRPCPRWRSGSP